MASLESTASSKRKTKEVIHVESLIPLELRERSAKLITLLEDYYEFMNKGFNPSYEISEINNERDIDTAQHYLEQIQREIAAVIPRKLQTDKIKLYKNLVQFYNIRGSTESIELFFRILLQDNVEIYYPQNDVLIPSDGKWDQSNQRYLTNDGFLSDRKKLQDSYFYQKFSYVIRTGNNVETWKDTFSKLVHPSGFIFFGEIFLFILALQDKAKMPFLQPGYIGKEDIPVIIELFAQSNQVSLAESLYTLLLVFYFLNQFEQRRREQFSDLLKFYDETPMYAYGNFTIEQGINKTIDRTNVGVSITTSSM